MIARNPSEAATTTYDLIVVGGGIYGVMLTLEAARRGLRPLLLERGDYGEATSWNSLRIVHGGLRYLQSLDLRRFRESVTERNWFLRNFPDLVRPLRCLMPLYDRGLRRHDVMSLALRLNDGLSRQRNRGVRADRALPDGELLTPDEVRNLYPSVPDAGLRGGALWHDAVMVNSQRVLIEALRWAASYRAAALNYVEVEELRIRDGRVGGVRAVDRLSGESLDFAAPLVVNAAGPWVRSLAQRLDGGRDVPELFHPSLAFNVLLEREPLAPAALAVTTPAPGARTFFLVPWQGRVLAGTYHLPWHGPIDGAEPTEEHVAAFLRELTAAVPQWTLGPADVARVHAGLLPATHDGTEQIAVREVIHDHGQAGGVPGLFSVSGVKFTTARLVAEKTLRKIDPKLSRDPVVLSGTERPLPARQLSREEFTTLKVAAPEKATAYLTGLIRGEAVVRLEDLLLRRTDWGYHPGDVGAVSAAIAECLDGETSLLARDDERLTHGPGRG